MLHAGFSDKNGFLAIMSVTSIQRKSFIIALLGLGPVIGHDAMNASNHDELMTFKKLRDVLGPCLLGSLAVIYCSVVPFRP